MKVWRNTYIIFFLDFETLNNILDQKNILKMSPVKIETTVSKISSNSVVLYP